MSESQFQDLETSSSINIKEVLFPYLLKWRWFMMSFFVVMTATFFYIRYSTPIYDVSASILVKDEKKGDVSSALSSFSDMGLDLGGVQSKLENEIEILKSRTILSLVTAELKTNISYFAESRIAKKQLYKNTFIKINIVKGDSSIYEKEATFRITIKDGASFIIEDLTTQKTTNQSFGTKFKTSVGEIVILPTSTRNRNIKDKKIIVEIEKFDKIVDDYQENIKIEAINKESSAIKIATKIENIDQGKAIINCLIKKHSEDAIKDKNQVSKNTLSFIEERLDFITKELSGVEGDVSDFKASNKIFDLTTNASLFFENESDNQKLLLQNETELKIAEYTYDHVSNSKRGELIPANIGIMNPSIEKTIETINTLQLERNKLIQNASEKNSVIINIDNQLENFKINLKDNLTNQINSIKIRNNNLKNQNNLLQNKLTAAPKQEKDFREIARQQQIKESLYLFLLQKREETQLSLAVIEPNTKIIDYAYSDGVMVSPKKKIIFLSGFLLSLLVPIGLIYVLNLFDTKIHGKKDITDFNLPLIGDIPHTDKTEKLIVSKTDRSSVTEAFRILRTNINFLSHTDNTAVVIMLTSTISKEGKSFNAVNLAAAYGIANKKTLLMGMDLRSPKLLEYLNLKAADGISDYVINKKIQWKDLIKQLPGVENVDLLPSGTIPPNPSELLMSDRISQLFEKAKTEYDYIIVDTAPIGMVADTKMLSDHADVLIYICRLDYLDKRLLAIPKALYEEKKFKNMSILLNGSKMEHGYGYGYGYGYGDTPKKEKKSGLLAFFKRTK